jgi:hypothetical protein
MKNARSFEHRPINWKSIILAELPSILLILQLSRIPKDQVWITFVLVLISGGYLIIQAYKQSVLMTSLFLPFIGALVLEFWILLGRFTNPHSSLLLTNLLLIILCIPSLILLYKEKSNLKKTIWLVIAAFSISTFLIYYKATHDWSIFVWNILQWMICIIPFFAFSVFCFLRFKIPLGLALFVFEPFWISYFLDPVGFSNHVFSINSSPQIVWGVRVLQLIPILGFLLVMPTINFRLSLNINSMLEQFLSLLFILPIVIIRFTLLAESQVQYLFPAWILILLYVFMLWFPLWLPSFFKQNKKGSEPVL